MGRTDEYVLKYLKKILPTEEACLDFIFKGTHSKECTCGGTFTRITGRKQYQCSKCRFHIAPTAHTIFHKSNTPLTLWFHAIFVYSNARKGFSAKELKRQIGVTYKTAWRVLFLIRQALRQTKTDQPKNIQELKNKN